MNCKYTQVAVHDHLDNLKEIRTYRGSIALACLQSVNFADEMGKVHDKNDYKELDYADGHDVDGTYMYKVIVPLTKPCTGTLAVYQYGQDLRPANCDSMINMKKTGSSKNCSDYYSEIYAQGGNQCVPATDPSIPSGCQKGASCSIPTPAPPPPTPQPKCHGTKTNACSLIPEETCENYFEFGQGGASNCKWFTSIPGCRTADDLCTPESCNKPKLGWGGITESCAKVEVGLCSRYYQQDTSTSYFNCYLDSKTNKCATSTDQCVITKPTPRPPPPSPAPTPPWSPAPPGSPYPLCDKQYWTRTILDQGNRCNQITTTTKCKNSIQKGPDAPPQVYFPCYYKNGCKALLSIEEGGLCQLPNGYCMNSDKKCSTIKNCNTLINPKNCATTVEVCFSGNIMCKQ